MSATATCVTPIKGSCYRLVQLDSCGNPVTGTGGMQVVAKGFIQCAMAPQYDAGVEFFSRTADGSLCVNQMDDPILKRLQLTIDFCEINQTGISYATTMTEIATGSPATGTGMSLQEGLRNNRWSLEIWQQVAGVNACDPVTGLQRWVYNAWPNVGAGQVGSYTIANAVAQFQVVAQTRAISTSATRGWWTKSGSQSWFPATWTPAGTSDHWYWNVTTTPPPSPACNPLAAL